ncbi:MAG: four helix bundle protein [Planctomycetes bacterium]|nr:four helix bundle protein [Planctomycetota bacterium]
MQNFVKLNVWAMAQELAVRVYGLSAGFPRDERFGLTSQLRRAAVSISSNIAEGARREFPADYARFLNFAQGSLAEVESLLYLAQRLSYLPVESLNALLERSASVSRMLSALKDRVVQHGKPPVRPPRGQLSA